MFRPMRRIRQQLPDEEALEVLKKVADGYERLSVLDYNYNPVKDGTPWYRAVDVWACIEEIPDGHNEFGAKMADRGSDTNAEH